MFGNNGRKLIISLPKQTKFHSEQMSISLLIVTFTILFSFSVDGRWLLEDCSQFWGLFFACRFYPLKGLFREKCRAALSLRSCPLPVIPLCLYVSPSRLVLPWKKKTPDRMGYSKRRFRARSIQPKFPEVSVQNSMDRFGPTGKVLKKRVHLLRWTTVPGRTGWNFGWMDRALWNSWERFVSRSPIYIQNGGSFLIIDVGLFVVGAWQVAYSL